MTCLPRIACIVLAVAATAGALAICAALAAYAAPYLLALAARSGSSTALVLACTGVLLALAGARLRRRGGSRRARP